MIQVKNLVKSFSGRRVLDGINLHIERGKITVIMGASGGGKSTLFKILIGALPPDSGEVWIDGEEITALNEDNMDEVRKKFGILFQNAALFNSLTVGENVALPLREHTRLAEDIIDIIVKLKLELVGLRECEHLKPSEISGGMQKRVGIARAMALDPQLVFYDEPSAGLDPILEGVIDTLILDLSRKLGITSVVITHELNSAFRIADRMLMLYKGKIVADGTPEEIKNSPDPLVQQFITGSPDGPIPLRQSSKDLKEDLIGM